MAQDYREGGQVKKGNLLFHIDPRPFQAALDQASSLLKNSKFFSERFCGERLVFNSITRVRE